MPENPKITRGLQFEVIRSLMDECSENTKAGKCVDGTCFWQVNGFCGFEISPGEWRVLANEKGV